MKTRQTKRNAAQLWIVLARCHRAVSAPRTHHVRVGDGPKGNALCGLEKARSVCRQHSTRERGSGKGQWIDKRLEMIEGDERPRQDGWLESY